MANETRKWGALLADLRRSQGVGLRDVAQSVGVSHQAVAGYEKAADPRIGTVERVLEALGFELAIMKRTPPDPVARQIAELEEVGP